MKKTLLLTLALFHTFLSYAQHTAQAPTTGKPAPLEGTKVSLVWPAGFVRATNFLGLQDDTGANIMVVEMPTPFSSTTQNMTKEGLEAQGLVVYGIEKLTAGGKPALLITGEQKAFGNTYSKYIYVMGDEQESTIINGVYPKELPEMGVGIKAALLSAYWEKGRVINPLDVVDFRIATGGTKLKVTGKALANTLIYTVDGNLPTKAGDKATYMAGKSISESEIENKEEFVVQRIRKLPFGISGIQALKPITLDGMEGYEVTALGRNPTSGAAMQVYEVIVFHGSLYYIILGHSENDFGKNLALFREITGTFKRK